MEQIRNLVSRYWRTGLIFLGGVILIVYIALGFLYLQQGASQKNFRTQIAQVKPVLARELPSRDELQAEYDRVFEVLAPVTDEEVIVILVDIARECGIDVEEEAGKFQIPVASYSTAKVMNNTYNVMSFGGIVIKGEHDKVMKFISTIQDGTYLKTMMVTQVSFSQMDVRFSGEEGERRNEFRAVIDAVGEMIEDNGLPSIPNPYSYSGGIATNLMGDNPETGGIYEGFPDITTTPGEKGYTGNATPRNGYVLYQHDKVSTANTSEYTSVNYYGSSVTNYYYTCESNGTVRQWSGTDVITATEYVDTMESAIETSAVINVVIYSKPKQ